MNRNEAEKIVISVLQKYTKGLDLSGDVMHSTLTELGVDSLDVMLLLMDLDVATGISINDDQAEELTTPSKMVEFLSSK